jgi:hypothetical protein
MLALRTPESMPSKIPGSGAEPQQHFGQPTDSAEEPHFQALGVPGEHADSRHNHVPGRCGCSRLLPFTNLYEFMY